VGRKVAGFHAGHWPLIVASPKALREWDGEKVEFGRKCGMGADHLNSILLCMQDYAWKMKRKVKRRVRSSQSTKG